jgi:DNA-binding NarL/FixJ family response regulator
VLIVEPQKILLLGLSSVFVKARHCQVIGEASSGEEAVQESRLKYPDVVVMDADLPDNSAILACQRIHAENERIGVILLASIADPRLVVSAIHAGAMGYLFKTTDPDHMVEAVEIVAGDGMYFPQEIANAVLEWIRAGEPGSNALERLSRQELRIMLLIAQGKTNRTIAAMLGLSEYTVKTYVSSTLRKLGFNSRAQAAAFIVRHQDEVTID